MKYKKIEILRRRFVSEVSKMSLAGKTVSERKNEFFVNNVHILNSLMENRPTSLQLYEVGELLLFLENDIKKLFRKRFYSQ